MRQINSNTVELQAPLQPHEVVTLTAHAGGAVDGYAQPLLPSSIRLAPQAVRSFVSEHRGVCISSCMLGCMSKAPFVSHQGANMCQSVQDSSR